MTARLSRFARLERRDLKILALILVVALVARVAVVVATPDYQPLFDSGDYQRHAVSIAEGNGFPDTAFARGGGPSAFRPPLFPYLVGGIYAATGDSITTARLSEAGLGVVAVLLVALIAGAMWGRRPALAAGGLAAVAPGLVTAGAALVTEPLFVVLELGAVAAVLAYRSAERPDWRWAAVAGLCCGLAALTRSNGALLLLAVAPALWLARPRRSLAMPAVALVAAALAVLPWTVRNAVTFHQLVPIASQSGFALAGEYNDEARQVHGHPATWLLPARTRRYGAVYADPRLDEAELDSRLRRWALGYALHHPGYVAEATFWNTGRALELASTLPASYDADLAQRGIGEPTAAVVRWSFLLLALLALAGVLALAKSRAEDRGLLLIWLIPVLMLGAAMPILGSPRYRTPIEPFVVLLAGLAVARLGAARSRQVAP